MKKVYFLKTCSTCKRIMSEFNLTGWDLRELKSQNITAEELQELYKITQSYEALFSKKSTQIKAREIDVKTLAEEDFKALILEHYSFLKRPVFLDGDKIFIGSEKKNIEQIRRHFGIENSSMD